MDEFETLPAQASGVCPSEGVCIDTEPECRGEAGWVCQWPQNYEAVESTCDGLDNDCDGVADEDLVNDTLDCKGVGVCRDGEAQCMGASGWKCSWPDTYEETETTCDGLDNDCDSLTDEGLQLPPEIECPQVGVCENGSPFCAGSHGWLCSDVDDYEDVETICDGMDNDCDGFIDEDLEAPDARWMCGGEGVCLEAEVVCMGTGGWRCRMPETHQSQESLCDEKDNDCDGLTDEGCPTGGDEDDDVDESDIEFDTESTETTESETTDPGHLGGSGCGDCRHARISDNSFPFYCLASIVLWLVVWRRRGSRKPAFRV